MPDFATLFLPIAHAAAAPDGSEIHPLLRLQGGSMAHFRLRAGQVSGAVAHRTVEEIWFVVSGTGRMWRKQGEREEVTALEPGLCLTVPLGTHFQFRAAADSALAIVAVTMPPWPGDGEAVAVAGPWASSG